MMEIDKFKKWMDAAHSFQSEAFWNNIFDSKQTSAAPFNPQTISDFFPKCDLFEEDNMLILEAEVPGLERDHLNISIQQQVLTIKGEFKSLQTNRKYHIKERANRKFKKELILPYPTVSQQIKTDIKNGILMIFMPINLEEVEDIPITFNSTHPD